MPKRKEKEYYESHIGERHGKLVIIEICDRNEKDRFVAKCQCDCGNIHYTELHSILADKLASCGCSRKMYKGLPQRHNDRLYCIYYGIKERCYNSKSASYHNYGGRGIKMCDEWYRDYASFREYALANGYAENLTIDRIDVNGDYCPENCRWITWMEQCNNKRENIKITYNDETHTVAEWSRITGLAAQKIAYRFKRGFPLDVVFSQKRLASRGKYV